MKTLYTRHKYAQHLFSTLITPNRWKLIKDKRAPEFMAEKRAIALTMVKHGISMSLCAEIMDTDRTNIQYWLKDDMPLVKSEKVRHRMLRRDGLDDFQLWELSR